MDGWQPECRSGQFITLSFFAHGREKRRSYSLTCSPELNERLCITVKKIDNGEFSRWLVYHAKVGDVLLTTGISGYFVLPLVPEEFTYFFFAAGSGITPCYSLIHLLLETTSAQVILVYSNKSVRLTMFYKELELWAEKYGVRFTVHYFFSDSANLENKRLTSFLLTKLMQQHAPADNSKVLCYLCGPFDYRQMATITLKSIGISERNIRKEEFDPFQKPRLNPPPDTAAYKVTIMIRNEKHIVSVQYPKSIVTTAKEHNIVVPYSCESGQCGSCAATCVSGKIWMAYNEVLTDDEISRGRVLTCVGFPIGSDAVIDYGTQ